jgi:hypothetical protein
MRKTNLPAAGLDGLGYARAISRSGHKKPQVPLPIGKANETAPAPIVQLRGIMRSMIQPIRLSLED